MDRKTAADFPQELLDLFDGYVHGRTSRRGFLKDAQKFAVGGLTAAMLFEMLRPNYALAQQVARDDTRIRTTYETVPSPAGTGSIKGYLARPANAALLPVVLVIHENRGLNPYIEDVARRLAVANFIAFAPDGLTSLGGYPGDDEKGLAMFGQIDRDKMGEDFLAAATWLKARPDGTGKLGAVGFCAGGSAVEATTRCSCVSPPFCSTPTSSLLAFQSAQRANSEATRPKSPSQTSMCSQPLLDPTTIFIACCSGSLILASLVQSPEPPAKTITPSGSATSLRMPPMQAIGTERFGFFASSAAIARPSIARKNQIANGIAATMPGRVAALKLSAPDQPPLTKCATENAGDVERHEYGVGAERDPFRLDRRKLHIDVGADRQRDRRRREHEFDQRREPRRRSQR